MHDPLVFYDTSSYGPEAIRCHRHRRGGSGSSCTAATSRSRTTARTRFERAFCSELADVVRRDAPARALGYTWVPVLVPSPLAGLRDTLLEYAAQPERLAPSLVRHDADERTYDAAPSRQRGRQYVVCWMAGHDTGFHDHDESAAAIAVVDGAISEERLSRSEGYGEVGARRRATP